MFVLEIFAIYALLGLAAGAAFVSFGLDRVLPGVHVSSGARLCWLPGAAILWPYALLRWLSASGAPQGAE
jgi:hypothetical protein